MIDLFTARTPNTQKIHIMIEETGLEHREFRIDIGKGDQFTPEYLAINPNNKVPTIVDHDPADGGERFAVFESGAILIYLAEKTGRFLSTDPRPRSQTLQWLMFQMGSVGPMLGQAHHFRAYAREKIPYAIDRYTKEASRIYHVLNTQLGKHEFLVDEYSIADMAVFPWIRLHERQGQELDSYANVNRWFQAVSARPAVERDMERLSAAVIEITDEFWRNMWGEEQYKQR
jgi:GST-like protein